MRYDHLSDDEVLSTVTSLAGNERGTVVSIIALIREVEDRRLERRDAYSSIHDFCFRALKLSESEARRRVNVARLSKRCPQVLDALASGAVNLTNLDLMRDVMTKENADELLAYAADKTRFEVEVLVASLAPKPDVPSNISPLPENRSGRKQPYEPPLKPLSPGRYRIQMTGDEDLRGLIERAKQLTRHANPHGDIAVIFKAALEMLVPKLEKEKLGKGIQPRKSDGPKDAGVVSAAARREVFERDGERCTYVSPSGQRCPAQAWLELDHREARARGGEGSVENLRVFCKAHNQYEAEQTFGRDHVEKKIAERRAAAEKTAKALASEGAPSAICGNVGSPKPTAAPSNPSTTTALDPDAVASKASAATSKASAATSKASATSKAAERSQDRKPPTAEPQYAILKRALVGLGFRAKEVDSGIATLSAETWSLPMEALLREALAKLT